MKYTGWADTVRRLLFKNLYLKLIAAVMTIAIYAWVSGDRETMATGYAPVELTAPDGMVLVSETTDWVEVTLRGQRSVLDRFDPSELDPVRIDLSPADDNSYAYITPAMVGVPAPIRVTRIDPNSIFVELEEEKEKTVEVEPIITGEPAPSYIVESVEVTPAEVSVRGPASEIDALDSLATDRIDISDRDQPLRRSVELDIDSDHLIVDPDTSITVEIQLSTEDVTETVEIPVEVVNTGLETTLDVETGLLTLVAPPSVLDELDRDWLRAEIDMGDEGHNPGVYSRPAEVVNLPDGVDIEGLHPERFRVVLEEPPPDPQEP